MNSTVDSIHILYKIIRFKKINNYFHHKKYYTIYQKHWIQQFLCWLAGNIVRKSVNKLNITNIFEQPEKFYTNT